MIDFRTEEALKIYEEHLARNNCSDSDLQKKMSSLFVWPWKKVPKDDRIKLANELLEVQVSHVRRTMFFTIITMFFAKLEYPGYFFLPVSLFSSLHIPYQNPYF